MQAVFREAIDLLTRGRPVVIATVVRTKGSTPQKPGAKLLVREDGSGVGTLGGGCVEGDIWYAARELLARHGAAEFRSYELNEELAAQDGLVCGGTMYFLIEPVYRPEDLLAHAREIDAAYQGGGAVAMASLVRAPAGGVASVGARLLVREDETTEGSLGDAGLDRDAIERARRLMLNGGNDYVVTGGQAEYYIEGYTTPPQLLLCGGGHVSRAIARVAAPLGFRIMIVDDREEFANRERFPEAALVVARPPDEAIPELPINANTYVVVATRGHRYDNVALAAAAATPARYVGLIGSKRKTILIYEDLVRAGVPLERIEDIRAPIGLDIHARTPEEIAVSIMAEILMFRLGGTGQPMKLERRHLDRIVQKVRGSVQAVG